MMVFSLDGKTTKVSFSERKKTKKQKVTVNDRR